MPPLLQAVDIGDELGGHLVFDALPTLGRTFVLSQVTDNLEQVDGLALEPRLHDVVRRGPDGCPRVPHATVVPAQLLDGVVIGLSGPGVGVVDGEHRSFFGRSPREPLDGLDADDLGDAAFALAPDAGIRAMRDGLGFGGRHDPTSEPNGSQSHSTISSVTVWVIVGTLASASGSGTSTSFSTVVTLRSQTDDRMAT